MWRLLLFVVLLQESVGLLEQRERASAPTKREGFLAQINVQLFAYFCSLLSHVNSNCDSIIEDFLLLLFAYLIIPISHNGCNKRYLQTNGYLIYLLSLLREMVFIGSETTLQHIYECTYYRFDKMFLYILQHLLRHHHLFGRCILYRITEGI